MSGLSAYLLLRPFICFKRCVGLVQKLMFSSVCFQCVVCSVLMSASISVLSSCMRVIVFGLRGMVRRCQCLYFVFDVAAKSGVVASDVGCGYELFICIQIS